MDKKLILVDVSVLPDDFKKVVRVKELLKSADCANLKEAVEQAGTTEEVYNKYCDYVFELATAALGKQVVFSFILSHQAGVLSKLLVEMANSKANVLTISQETPEDGKAHVRLKIDVSELNKHLDALVAELRGLSGIEKVNLESIE